MTIPQRTRSLKTLLTATLAVLCVPSVGEARTLVGRQTDGSVVVTTNQVLRPAGRQVEFRGRPMSVVLSPDGKSAALLNGTANLIILLDLASATVKQEFTAPGTAASFGGLLYSADGTKLFASQATGSILVADVAVDGTLALRDFITTLPKSGAAYPGREDGDPYPGGLALSADGRRLLVALNRNNSLAVVDLATYQVIREIPVGNAPTEVVVQGSRAFVSNRGGRRASAADFTQDSSGTRIVADRRVGYASSGTVSVVDLDAGVERAAIEVGLQPSALLLRGGTLFVANTGSDTISLIDVTSNRVVKTIRTTPFFQAPLGSSPNGLAMIGEETLVVSLGRSNALALYDLGGRDPGARLKGLVPTGWYPTGVVVDTRGQRLIVANGKGVGSLGPEATVGPDPATNKTGKWVHSNQGSASIIPFPERGELARMTRRVFSNNAWDEPHNHPRADRSDADERRPAAVPVPEQTGDPSVFKHVFYIIKENRTYDQVFGALSQGNGDPNLVQFGRDVTPNHHALAEQFVLLDNLYDCGSNSADGHQWATQAFAADYVEKSFGSFTRTYPFNGGDALVYPRTGFLWDNALRQQKSVRVYGEYVNGLRANGQEMGPWTGTFLGHGETDAGVWGDFYRDALLLSAGRNAELHVQLEAHTEIPALSKLINRSYPPYNQVIPDQYRAEVFLKEFAGYVRDGNLPELVVMALTNDHTQGTTANYPTPRAMVADNDLALGRVVDAISHSPYWKDSVIFVVEDDAQNGVDHVDGHRTIGFVVSPYTKRTAVESHYYTQIDMIRTMEQILGLYAMNQMDNAVEPSTMRRLFTRAPDFRPYQTHPNLVPLDELNPAPSALFGFAREWAIASSQLDFSHPDAADEYLLNRAIWYSTTHFKRAYPGDPRVLHPHEVRRETGDEDEREVASQPASAQNSGG